MLHDQVHAEQVGTYNTYFTEKGKDLCNKVSEREFQEMLNIQKEPIPGSGAESISRDGHVCESSSVDVVTNLFDASQNAISASNEALDSLVVSTSLGSLLSDIKEDKSNSLNHSNDERSNSDRTSVVNMGEFESKSNISLSFFIFA